LIFIAFCFLLPLLWMLLASFDVQAVQSIKIPEHFSLQNYKEVFSNSVYMRGFLNSIIVSVCQVCIVMISSLLAGYQLSKGKMKHSQEIMLTLLFMTSLPVLSIMVPVYQMFLMLHVVDNMVALILFMSAAAIPYAIWMSKNFFDAISNDLLEAALVDGASKLQCLVKIILPLMKPGILTVAVHTFIGSWGNFFVPFILLVDDQKFTASINIYRFFSMEGDVLYGQIAAYSVLYSIPVVVLYFFVQSHMSKGFALEGASKG
jgi:multiple sugar transport system permease protein